MFLFWKYAKSYVFLIRVHKPRTASKMKLMEYYSKNVLSWRIIYSYLFIFFRLMSVGPLHLSYYNNHNINPLELCNNEFSCFFCVEKKM